LDVLACFAVAGDRSSAAYWHQRPNSGTAHEIAILTPLFGVNFGSVVMGAVRNELQSMSVVMYPGARGERRANGAQKSSTT
jgi:hypothetical protein